MAVIKCQATGRDRFASINAIDGLVDPQIDRLIIIGEPEISVEQAKVVRDLLHSPVHDKLWSVSLFLCWPENNAAAQILKEAFSVEIQELVLNFYSSSHERHCDMIECAFPNETATSTTTRAAERKKIYFQQCAFGPQMSKIIRNWSSSSGVKEISFGPVGMLGVENNKGPERYPLSFLATSFCDVPDARRPSKISFDLDIRNPEIDVGDFSLLRDWKHLETIYLRTNNKKVIRSLPILPQLRDLTINQTNQEFKILCDAIVGILQQDDCRLESIFCQLDGDRAIALLEALKMNTTVIKLGVFCGFGGQSASSALVDFIEENTPLKEIFLGIGGFSSNRELRTRLVRALSTTNCNMELLRGGFGAKDNVYLMPFTARNWAGRRLLAQQADIPPGLWPHVFARIRISNIRVAETSAASKRLCVADATYHLIRGAVPSLFGR